MSAVHHEWMADGLPLVLAKASPGVVRVLSSSHCLRVPAESQYLHSYGVACTGNPADTPSWSQPF